MKEFERDLHMQIFIVLQSNETKLV